MIDSKFSFFVLLITIMLTLLLVCALTLIDIFPSSVWLVVVVDMFKWLIMGL